MLPVATIGGLLTYICGKGTQRERLIRKHCGELISICIDPARLSSETCQALEQHMSECSRDSLGEGTRSPALVSLVRIRMRIAEGEDPTELENQTDALLMELDACVGA